jgi:hypothetical protein
MTFAHIHGGKGFMESRGCSVMLKKRPPPSQIAGLAQHPQIFIQVTAIQPLWDDVINVHLSFGL